MQLRPCISVLKLPGRLLNHSEAIKLTQGSLIATEMALNWKIRAQENTKCWGSQGMSARGEGLVTAQAR